MAKSIAGRAAENVGPFLYNSLFSFALPVLYVTGIDWLIAVDGNIDELDASMAKLAPESKEFAAINDGYWTSVFTGFEKTDSTIFNNKDSLAMWIGLTTFALGRGVYKTVRS